MSLTMDSVDQNPESSPIKMKIHGFIPFRSSMSKLHSIIDFTFFDALLPPLLKTNPFDMPMIFLLLILSGNLTVAEVFSKATPNIRVMT